LVNTEYWKTIIENPEWATSVLCFSYANGNIYFILSIDSLEINMFFNKVAANV